MPVHPTARHREVEVLHRDACAPPPAELLARPPGLAVLPFESPERWMPHLNIAAWIADGAVYYSEGGQTCVDDGTGMVCTGERVLTAGAAAAYLLSVLGLVVAASLATFTRRDIP